MNEAASPAAAMIVDHTNVGAAFRRLCIPIAVTMLGDQLLSVVDTIVIGSLGTVSLAGATGATAVFIALLYALIGFASGLSIVAAQRIGAHDLDGFGATVRAGTAASLVAALIVIGAAFAFAEPLLRAMLGALPSVHAAGQYLVLRSVSLIPMMISIGIANGVAAAGNRRLAVHLLFIINIVHVPLVLVLARGWLTGHSYGIAGAALSSLAAEIVGASYIIGYVIRHPEYHIFKSLRVDLRLAYQTARLSLPEVVFLLAVLAPDAFIVALLAPLGPLTVAGFRALNVVSDFTFVIPIPLQEATQTVLGQRLGARDPLGAQTFFVRARAYTLRVSTWGALGVALLAWPLAYGFTLNAAVASLAAVPLALHMLTLPLKGYAMLSMAPLRASGDTRFSMFAGLLCSALVLPVAWFGVRVLHAGLYAVPLAWVTAWLARAVVTHLRLMHDDWAHRDLALRFGA